MTDDEKHRVNELLSNLDNIPESFVDDGASDASTVKVHVHRDIKTTHSHYSMVSSCVSQANPYQITLSSNEGFHPAHDEMRRLEAIDQRLQRLMPRSDFESIASLSPRLLSAQVSTCPSRTDTRGLSPRTATSATSSLPPMTSVDFQQLLVRQLKWNPRAYRKF